MFRKLTIMFGVFCLLTTYAEASVRRENYFDEGIEYPAFPKKLQPGTEGMINFSLLGTEFSPVNLADFHIQLTFEDQSIQKIYLSDRDKLFGGEKNFQFKFQTPHIAKDQQVKLQSFYKNQILEDRVEWMRFFTSTDLAQFLAPAFPYPVKPGSQAYVNIAVTPCGDDPINFKDMICIVAIKGYPIQEKNLSRTDLILTGDRVVKVRFIVPEISQETKSNFSLYYRGKKITSHTETIKPAQLSDKEVVITPSKEKFSQNYCYFCKKIVRADMDRLRKMALKEYEKIYTPNRIFIEDEKLCVELPPGIYYPETKIEIKDVNFQVKNIVCEKQLFSVSGTGKTVAKDEEGNVLKIMPTMVKAEAIEKIDSRKCYHVHIPKGIYHSPTTTIVVKKGDL